MDTPPGLKGNSQRLTPKVEAESNVKTGEAKARKSLQDALFTIQAIKDKLSLHGSGTGTVTCSELRDLLGHGPMEDIADDLNEIADYVATYSRKNSDSIRQLGTFFTDIRGKIETELKEHEHEKTPEKGVYVPEAILKRLNALPDRLSGISLLITQS